MDYENPANPQGVMLLDVTKLSKEEILELARGRSFAVWDCKATVNKYQGDPTEEDILQQKVNPYESVERSFNLLMYGGVSCLWQCLIGNGSASAGLALTFFNNAQAAIGVGDSSTAAAATQTNLQASSNKLRTAMMATYPVHTDGVTSAANTISFQSQYTSGQANFAWNEVGVFNSTSDGTGRMLNRLVQSFGTKSSGTWTLTIQITIS